MDEMDVRNDEQRNKYQPKLLSYKKILYHVSDHLKEGLHQLKKNKLDLLLPEETTCRHCGSQLDGGDPVENGWVAYDSCVIITNTDINYAKGKIFFSCTPDNDIRKKSRSRFSYPTHGYENHANHIISSKQNCDVTTLKTCYFVQINYAVYKKCKKNNQSCLFGVDRESLDNV